jgi:uncharacterized protein
MKTLFILTSLAVATCSRTPEELSPSAPAVVASSKVAAPTSAFAPLAAPVVIPPSGSLAKASATDGAASPAALCPVDPDPASFKPKAVEASFESGPKLNLEVVYRQDDTAHGLMYRRTMPETQGMLFKMKNEVHTFWMHNTCMSLDMLFLDESGIVLGLLERVPPLNDDRRSIGVASTYVLEVVAGYASKHGITKGKKLEIPVSVKALKL